MSEESKNNEWDSLWQEYTKSLENWKTLFEESLSSINASLVPKKIDHADGKRYEKILRKRWIRNEGKPVLKPLEL